MRSQGMPIMKIKTDSSFTAFPRIYQRTRRHIPEDNNLGSHDRENILL